VRSQTLPPLSRPSPHKRHGWMRSAAVEPRNRDVQPPIDVIVSLRIARPSARTISIALLPFESLSPSASDSWLAVGLVQDPPPRRSPGQLRIRFAAKESYGQFRSTTAWRRSRKERALSISHNCSPAPLKRFTARFFAGSPARPVEAIRSSTTRRDKATGSVFAKSTRSLPKQSATTIPAGAL
jgi:hypothetical protein